jgi:hypothetical protein
LIGACLLAVAIMIATKILAYYISFELPWGTATTIGGVLACFVYTYMHNTEAKNLSTASDPLEKSNEREGSVAIPAEKYRRVEFWFRVTTLMMYPMLILCAYETNNSKNYGVGCLWILTGLAYFYSYHLFKELLKK